MYFTIERINGRIEATIYKIKFKPSDGSCASRVLQGCSYWLTTPIG